MKRGEPRSNDDAADVPCLELDEITAKDKNNDVTTNDTATNQNGETSKPSRRPRSKSTNSNESFTMCQRLWRRDYSTTRKVVWVVILVGLAAVCLWQVIDRIQYYLSEPTSFQVTVDRLHEIHFPAITICPAREPFHNDDWDKAFSLPNFFDSPKSNFSLKEIWEEFAIREKDLSVSSACNGSNFCDFINGVNTTLNATSLPTFWGLCATLSQDFPAEYRGMATYWAIFLNPGPYEREWFDRHAAAQYFLHDLHAIYRHEAFLFADLWSLGGDTIIQFTLKQFEFLNLTRDPCASQEQVIRCKNKCIDDSLEKIVNCSLPFMTSKWPACRTGLEAKRAFDQTRDFYYTYNWTRCVCKRQCRENVYVANTNTAEKRPDDRSVMVFQLADNLVERVYEEHSYSFSALLSDIGGSIGIFLGFSILSLLQLLEENVLDGFKKE